MGNVEHVHSARTDVDVFDRCGESGNSTGLDVLGDRVPATSDIQAQRRWHRLAGWNCRHQARATPDDGYDRTPFTIFRKFAEVG